MSVKIPYSVTNDSVFVLIDGRPVTVQRTAVNFLALRDAVIAEDWEEVRWNLSAGSSLSRWARDRFTVVGNTIRFDGESVPEDFNARIVEMASTGQSPEPLFRFWERLQRNPSGRSVSQLWRFLNLVGIPITESGHFLAYKGIRTDFKDQYTGLIDNSPGELVRVARNKVSDDPQTPCHFGLHVGSLEYAAGFGARVVIVKVDPEHVVCVPYDCTSQKMRVCEYEVVGLHGEGHMPSTTIPNDDWDPSDWANSDSDDDTFPDGWESSSADDDVVDAVLHAPFERDREEKDSEKACSLSDCPGHAQASSKKRPPKWIRELDEMDGIDLYGANMDLLRRYASKALRIVGAYRIPGGKDGLISAILKGRR